jgi:hypothetical protein
LLLTLGLQALLHERLMQLVSVELVGVGRGGRV